MTQKPIHRRAELGRQKDQIRQLVKRSQKEQMPKSTGEQSARKAGDTSCETCTKPSMDRLFWLWVSRPLSRGFCVGFFIVLKTSQAFSSRNTSRRNSFARDIPSQSPVLTTPPRQTVTTQRRPVTGPTVPVRRVARPPWRRRGRGVANDAGRRTHDDLTTFDDNIRHGILVVTTDHASMIQ